MATEISASTTTISTSSGEKVYYSFDVVESIKLSSFFILIYYAITNLCVVRLKTGDRLYSVVIAIYGFTMCLLLALHLL